MANKKIEELAVLIANMVYKYQGSDPEVQKKQVGKKVAAETLEALLQEREREAVEGFVGFVHKESFNIAKFGGEGKTLQYFAEAYLKEKEKHDT